MRNTSDRGTCIVLNESKRNETERNKTNRKEIYDLSAELTETLNKFYFSLSNINLLSVSLYVIQYPFCLFNNNVYQRFDLNYRLHNIKRKKKR